MREAGAVAGFSDSGDGATAGGGGGGGGRGGANRKIEHGWNHQRRRGRGRGSRAWRGGLRGGRAGFRRGCAIDQIDGGDDGEHDEHNGARGEEHELLRRAWLGALCDARAAGSGQGRDGVSRFAGAVALGFFQGFVDQTHRIKGTGVSP